MASKVDFESLRARAMDSGADEEAVTVNTRALIDKVLARYSGEWTVLRELLQNAADATAKKVTIKFETIPSTSVPAPAATDATSQLKHVISHHTLKTMIVTNDGLPFSSNDWARLKRIAEGNPDETKIGAFGVGFYSVFSDCEEPFVSSGSEAMAFYWKGNALYTRRLKLSEAEASGTTNFVLQYRNTTSPVPSLIPLCQFLASSLTFAGLETVELWLDDWNLLSLRKKVAPSVEIRIPRSIETRTTKGLLQVTSVSRQVAQMDGTIMAAVAWKSPTAAARNEADGPSDTTKALKSFFSRFAKSVTQVESSEDTSKQEAAEDLTSTTSQTVFFNVSTAQVRSSVASSFSKELERATKKPPPRTTTLAVLTSSYNASSPFQSNPAAVKNVDIFASVLPTKSGRIFIGFTTHQTTGLHAHVSAPSLIPTVERESIDLNARWVRDWNFEILRAVGIVCRVAWTTEMSDLKYKIPAARKDRGLAYAKKEDVTRYIPEAVYIMNQFTFHESTPSSRVGEIIVDSFWTSDRDAFFEVLSTRGVLPTSQIRVAPKDLSFMENIPSIPDEVMTGAKEFVRRLTDFGLVTEISIGDIRRELENNALTSQQLSEFLRWAANKVLTNEYTTQTIQGLLAVVVANDEGPDGTPQGLLCLNDIRCYLQPNKIPVDLPVPPVTMPFRYTNSLPPKALQALGWNELDISTWLQWLVRNAGNRSVLTEEKDITKSFAFSARILPILSKQWDTIGISDKAIITTLLKERTVIPTRLGMRRPPETYFPYVRLFEDLPIVTGLNGVKDKFLVNLGVRKTVDLNVIFERLLSEQPEADTKGRKKWNHVDLIKYLASVWNDIPQNDILKLKGTRFCVSEPDGKQDSQQVRYRACDLFEPEPRVKDLGFPVISWPGQYSRMSVEGRFLSSLGLRQYPSVPELIRLMADAAAKGDVKLREKALLYFLAEHMTNGYASYGISGVTSPFLPVEGSTKVSTPGGCFVDEGAKLFGFDLLRKDLHGHAAKLGVKQHPPLQACLAKLHAKLPNSRKEARIYFEYFYKRIGDLDSTTAAKVGQTPIVPVRRTGPSEKDSKLVYLPPVDCYLGDSEDYRDIFEFVDFGPEGNLFLMACGSKREPTKIEVARLLVREPAKILSKLQTPDKYLTLLRHIAENITMLRKDRTLFQEMKRARFLLGSKEIKQSDPVKDDDATLVSTTDLDDDLEEGIKEWELTRATDAIIVDDYSSFSLFKESVLAAPQEEALEELYLSLGTPFLSSLVEAQSKLGYLLSNQRPAEKLKKQILERVRLFLHDQPKEAIKHDAKWLEQHIIVQNISSILYRRTLKGKGISHTERRGAIITPQGRDFVLAIADGRLDYYQISQSLAQIILQRPKLHSTLTLEMLLKTDLLELRARGYNVERILRAKAAEARIAECQRLNQLEEERARQQTLDMERAKAQQLQQQQQQEQPNMPGNFPGQEGGPRPETTDAQATGQPAQRENRPQRGFLSDLRDMLIKGTASQNSPQQQTTQQSIGDPEGERTPRTPRTPEGGGQVTTSPRALQDNLDAAVRSCRPYGSKDLYSRGEKNQVAETKSYCDERPSQNLRLAGEFPDKMRIFVSPAVQDANEFIGSHNKGLRAFKSVLVECANIFSLPINTVNIFHDPGSKTIAFNTSGSIFCNYASFEKLHEESARHGEGLDNAFIYWWVTLCHELAHNLVGDHSSAHGYYTESFVAQYFAKATQRAAQLAQQSMSNTGVS